MVVGCLRRSGNKEVVVRWLQATKGVVCRRHYAGKRGEEGGSMAEICSLFKEKIKW